MGSKDLEHSERREVYGPVDACEDLHWGAGVRVQGAGFRVQGAGCRGWGLGCRVQGLGFGSFGFRFQYLTYRLGFRVSKC